MEPVIRKVHSNNLKHKIMGGCLLACGDEERPSLAKKIGEFKRSEQEDRDSKSWDSDPHAFFTFSSLLFVVRTLGSKMFRG